MVDLMTHADPAAAATRYQSVRARTEQLAAPLSAEDQTVQSMPDVSPTKWHRAHTSWFFETFMLQRGLPGYRAYEPVFAYLFNSYYESVGDRYPRPMRGVISRPGIGEVAAYRDYVDEAMGRLFAAPLHEDLAFLLELGLHHEQQHQELVLMDIKHVLSCNPFRPAYRPLTARAAGAARGPATPVAGPAVGAAPSAPGPATWIEQAGGLVEIGHDGAGFAFDNETPRHQVQLVPFALAAGPVTCGQWADFVEDGGYHRPELWLSDGWATVQSQGWEAPLYWWREDDGWNLYTLHGPKALDPSEPVVHVSYYEADAFARWAGARLPTEAEWEAVAAGAPAGSGSGALSGSDPTGERTVLHPQAGPSLFGEVWQWTSSAYLPYPGFHPAPGAVGEYNGKFMVNQMVLRGGCCATPPGHLRVSYRNFFPPSARWAFSGLRLARDE